MHLRSAKTHSEQETCDHSETKAASAGKQNPVETVAEHTKPETVWLVAKHVRNVAKPIILRSCATAMPSQRRRQADSPELRLSMRSTQMKMSRNVM